MSQGVKLIIMESQTDLVHYSDGIFEKEPHLEPLEYLEAYEDNKKLKADWDTLLRADPKRIIYAHANEKSF